MASFEPALKFALENEGGYSNNLNDPGGETYRGISRRYWPVWSGWGMISAAMKKLNPSLDQAGIKKLDWLLAQDLVLQQAVHDFYRSKFWNPLYENIASQSVATKIFDEAINLGVEAVQCLQQALVACGYPIQIDGKFGGGTLNAVNTVGQKELMPRFVDALSGHYIAEAKKNPKKKTFLAGWLNRAKEIPSGE